jgi:integrase
VAPTARREYGTGSITWLSSRRARLRVRVNGESGQRSKVVRVGHRDHGGRGEAAAELENFARAIQSEKVQSENQVRTVGEVLTAYIEHCRRIGRRQGTIESYEMVAKRITAELKAKPIDALTGHDFDDFYGDLGKSLGANTIRQTHAVLHAAFDQAVKWEWIAANPMTSATPPGRFKPKREALAMGDVHRMIQRASNPKELGGEGDLVLAMAVILATITGARRGELAGLRWEDVDEDTCSVRIERQWVPGKSGQHLGPPKSSDGPRTVVLGEVGMALIIRYRRLMGELLNREPNGWLLSHDAGTTPLRAKALGAAISRLGTSLGIEVSTHSFRRASATELMASGVDVDTSARRLGHTTEVMLQSYVLGSDDRAIAAAGTLETRLAARGLPLAELLPVPE